jgi:hypothetical protein
MKTKMKRQGSTELPRFAVGALAIAGASAANGATVQISFANNVVSTSAGLTLFDADLSGDNEAEDLHGQLGYVKGSKRGVMLWSPPAVVGGALSNLAGTSWVHYIGLAGASIQGAGWSRGLVAFTFADQNMNGGSPTAGWLDVSATTSVVSGASVQIHRLIFDDASTNAPTGLTSASTGIPEWQVSAVPEPGSNLALLALGAGGLTLRRRLKRAA